MKQTAYIVLILAFGLTSIINGQSNKKIKKGIEKYLAKKINKNEQGASVLIGKKGKILYSKGFGLANQEWHTPITNETVFQIGSLTKPITALCILQLVEKGKLSLEDSIQKFIPYFPSKDYTITIEHLLTHTSGIKEYLSLNHQNPFILRSDLESTEIIIFFKDEPLNFMPGTKFSYSNSGYFLLGVIIEKVSKLSYASYVKQNIFEACGMKNSFYGNNFKIIPNRATSYVKDNGELKKGDYWSMSIPYAAGALLSTTEDLFKWQQAVFNNKLLSKEWVTKAITKYEYSNGIISNYGYGWFLDFIDINGSKTIAHSGGISEFNSLFLYLPEEDIQVIVLSNYGDTDVNTIAIDLAKLASGNELASFQLNKELKESYKGTYESIIDGEKKTIQIYELENKLVLDTVEWKLEMVPLTNTKFQMRNARPIITVEFIKDILGNIKFISKQKEQLYEWKKID
ncbi:serine hydrolase domain-containing protein [Seonamhaeicola marinus]|uniref:Beta-lactamase family protein n=1 Tax=Seonamhaeicola marinus TaxID=1912246 RepID=A0A5D0IUQ5_9FLAO|nr:serine hydrolase domain-containing protein [Seonamhaeicola marinus]TYA86779.1 beta-lactamase family protein [Seonamhaeicola marinus]